jgi:AcrR family transcriptional regulator
MGAARRPAAQPAVDLVWLRPDTGARDQRPALSRDQIVRAAIKLADEHGLDAVSTRRIATMLGSGPTSMYWHVQSKADLYELMFDAALGEVELPGPASGDWQDGLRALARSTHLMLQRHPWLMLLGIQPGLGPSTRRYGEYGMRVLGGLGLDPKARTEVLAALNNYIFGFAHRETARDQLIKRAGLTEQQWQLRLRRYADSTRRRDPELARDIETRMHLTSNDSFEFGLDCLLNGIALRFRDTAILPESADRDPGTETGSRRAIEAEKRPAGGG